MHIKLIGKVVEDVVSRVVSEGIDNREEVLRKIRRHAEETSYEYKKPSPNIRYHDILCRAGYLYRQGPKQATLFERVLRQDQRLRAIIANVQKLYVVAIGGGPGTELLGLGKHLRSTPNTPSPKKIIFDVLDSVGQWADTWRQLSDEVEHELARYMEAAPTISANFQRFNVFEMASYADHDFLRSANIVVFNGIFSENQKTLSEAEHSVRHIFSKVPPGCAIVVIDRNEQPLRMRLARMLHPIFGQEPTINRMIGSLASDERKEDYGTLRPILAEPKINYSAFSCVHIKPSLPRRHNIPAAMLSNPPAPLSRSYPTLSGETPRALPVSWASAPRGRVGPR